MINAYGFMPAIFLERLKTTVEICGSSYTLCTFKNLDGTIRKYFMDTRLLMQIQPGENRLWSFNLLQGSNRLLIISDYPVNSVVTIDRSDVR